MEGSVSAMRGVDFCIRCGILHRDAIDAAQGLVPDTPGTADCPRTDGTG